MCGLLIHYILTDIREEMKNHQVTIIDIAGLGISKSTVSRALTNNSNISRNKEAVLKQRSWITSLTCLPWNYP